MNYQLLELITLQTDNSEPDIISAAEPEELGVYSISLDLLRFLTRGFTINMVTVLGIFFLVLEYLAIKLVH